MNKERELLKTILAYMCAEYLVITEFEMITRIEDTVKEVQELLNKPEPKREPLSDEEIKMKWNRLPTNTKDPIIRFARAIEKAHGIGGGE